MFLFIPKAMSSVEAIREKITKISRYLSYNERRLERLFNNSDDSDRFYYRISHCEKHISTFQKRIDDLIAELQQLEDTSQ